MLTFPDNIEELVDQFVRLRDKIKASDDAQKQKLAPFKEYRDQLEAKLLERLNDIGGESVKTSSGTVFRSTKKTASIADGDAFRSYVIDAGLFDLVDWKANAVAVNDHIKTEGTIPPGVNYAEHFSVNVRRA